MFFKIFSILYLLLYLSMYLAPKMIPLFGWQEWVAFAVSMVSIIGLFCYAYRIRLIGKSFWRYFLVFFILFEATYMIWLGRPFAEKANMAKELEWLNSVINILMELPVVYAIFRLQQKWVNLTNSKANSENKKDAREEKEFPAKNSA